MLSLAKEKGVITPLDIKAMGLAPENLNKLAKFGLIISHGRGIFEHPDFELTEMHSYVQVASSIPNAVMCLLTALSIHGIGTELPHEIWIAIPRGQRPPVSRKLPIRVVTMGSPYYQLGIESRTWEGVEVKVFSAAKTVVDCFRLRRLIGHDIAVEALKESLRLRLFTVNELHQTAKALKAWNTLRPYVEAILA